MFGDSKRAVLVREVKPTGPVPSLFGAGNIGVAIQPISPMGGSQFIRAGNAFRFTFAGEFNAVRIILDVPEGVAFDLEVNGSTIASGDDQDGCVGTLEVGDFSGKAYYPVRTVVFSGTNHDEEDHDVRAWLVGVNS